MTVCDEKVRLAVEIEVEEEQTKCKTQQSRATNRRTRSFVNEQAVAFVVVQAEHLSGEVSNRDARQAGLVVIRPVDAHGSPHDTFFAERNT